MAPTLPATAPSTGTDTAQIPRGTAPDFESIYVTASGDASRVPWSDGIPNPALVTWLDTVAPSLVRCGARVAVVGCGLGEDARELIRRGYEVTAFDLSPTAVNWARTLDPENASCYHSADVTSLPARWVHRFDLVVEIYTIQSVPPERRGAIMTGIARLVGTNGHLLAICRGSDAPVGLGDGPPWPLSERELISLGQADGLAIDTIHAFDDDESPPKRRIRAHFRALPAIKAWPSRRADDESRDRSCGRARRTPPPASELFLRKRKKGA